MTSGEKYVTAAHLVVLGIVLLYVVLYAFKLARLERALAEIPLTRDEQDEDEEVPARPS